MGFFTTITITFLALAALAVLISIVALFYNAIAGEPRAMSERLKFKRREKMVLEADLLIQHDDWQSALKRIRSSFYFEPVRYDEDLVDKISNHHQGLLSRLLIISEKRSRSIANIAIVEDLFLSRCEMMRAWLEALSSYKTLLKKRAGRVPGWALDEYKTKISEIEDRLNVNQKSLNSQLDLLFKALTDTSVTEAVTYH